MVQSWALCLPHHPVIRCLGEVMDDLAAAPTQRTYDDAGRVRDESFQARKKAPKKSPPALTPSPGAPAKITPEPEAEPDANHELDLLA